MLFGHSFFSALPVRYQAILKRRLFTAKPAIHEIPQYAHEDIRNGHQVYNTIINTPGRFLPLPAFQYGPAHGTLRPGRQYCPQKNKNEYVIFSTNSYSFLA